MTPQEVNKFLIDGSPTDARYLQNHSSELYIKDNNFILELLKNADDNNYLSENLRRCTLSGTTATTRLRYATTSSGSMRTMSGHCETLGILRRNACGERGTLERRELASRVFSRWPIVSSLPRTDTLSRSIPDALSE
ncbi:hypothetical protein BC936DRAFT_143488 [Jimgerdemannia flammicorona]|uniref:Uncharacterized protein n=1 Tax=Jimgerdemannia flammicorona TaxID=994334 RepID=A0A432ZYV8_9FUNG|nr:hypothetical protein BC936DRAFT_143488 [Jimgerdemannia flammicorona]